MIVGVLNQTSSSLLVEQHREANAQVAVEGPGRSVVEGVEIVETLNGGSREGENEQAMAYAERYGWHCIGGSDSHIVSHIGRYATRFEDALKGIDDLVAALVSGRFEAVQP